MSQQTLNNGETGLVIRGKINDNFTELYGTVLKTEWFEEIASGTSGTLTKPTGSTILLNSWADGVDALASVSAGVGDLPTFETPVTVSGTAITATLDAAGNWTLSGTPSAYPVCIIYAYSIPVTLFDEAESLTVAQTYADVEVEGTAILSTGEVGGTKFLREDGDGTCSWQTPAGAGDVTAAAVLGDNLIVRGDGAGKGVQNTGITVDDNDGVYGAGTVVENVAGNRIATDFALIDAGKTLVATGTTATWTWPLNSVIAFPVGTVINGFNSGSGLLTIAVTSTDTLESKGSLTDISVGAAFTMVKTATTNWHLTGGLE